MYRKSVLALPGFIAPFLALLLTTPASIHGQDLIASGAGDANSNGSYKETGTVNGKPQFESTSVSTVFIEWDGSQWILYNTGTGFTNYVNRTTRHSRRMISGRRESIDTPTLSGPSVSYPLAGTLHGRWRITRFRHHLGCGRHTQQPWDHERCEVRDPTGHV